MYHLSTFLFQKNESVKERVAEGISKYLPKNAMKLRKFPHFCCIFHQFMDHVSTNNKVSITAGQGREGLVVQSNVVKGRAGQCLQVKGSTCIPVSQKRLAVWKFKISCLCSIQSVHSYLSWHWRMMHNFQKICQVVSKMI